MRSQNLDYYADQLEPAEALAYLMQASWYATHLLMECVAETLKPFPEAHPCQTKATKSAQTCSTYIQRREGRRAHSGSLQPAPVYKSLLVLLQPRNRSINFGTV